MTAKYMEPASAPPQRNANTSRRILVAEDDVLMLRVNVKMLAKSGYEVDGAADGYWPGTRCN
jgi:PleD family two-component response regulator